MYKADSLNFISKLSPKRIWNGVQVLSSYYYSKWSGQATQWGLPIMVSFEPTTSCNLRCPECPSGLRSFTRPTGMLEKELYENTIDQIADQSIYLYFYFQGEPYLHKEFTDLVSYANDKGLYTVTSTNAHFLNDENAKKTIESGLDRIIISIDGTSQETYENYRVGGKLEKVIQGTKKLLEWKKKLNSKTPHTIFQFLVVRPNEHQIEEVYRIADELGIDEVKLKTAQVYDYENGNDLIPTIDKYARYRKNSNGTWSIKNKLVSSCWKLWHACVITWDGVVVPCCFDKDAEYPMGDLKNTSFRDLWRGELYQEFRGKIITGRDKIDICSNCAEGTKVWA